MITMTGTGKNWNMIKQRCIITMTGTGKNWNLIKQRCMITMTGTGKSFEKVLNSKSIPPIGSP